MADKEKAKEARGVDSVTDYVEEEQVGDEEKAKASLAGLGESNSTVSSSRTNITIDIADIDFVAEECEISKEKAESLLRKNQGNSKAAIIGYIHGA